MCVQTNPKETRCCVSGFFVFKGPPTLSQLENVGETRRSFPTLKGQKEYNNVLLQICMKCLSHSPNLQSQIAFRRNLSKLPSVS